MVQQSIGSLVGYVGIILYQLAFTFSMVLARVEFYLPTCSLLALDALDLISAMSACGIGRNVGGHLINILAYADDIVLIAPSWKALQKLLNILHEQTGVIDMVCNVDKTVCMMFAPTKRRDMVIATNFHAFQLGSSFESVQQFKYLGHIISCNRRDDKDIQREIRNIFIRTNITARRFSSLGVQLLSRFCYLNLFASVYNCCSVEFLLCQLY